MVRRQMAGTALLQNLDPDKVLENFGKYGRYQLLVYMMATIGFIIFSYVTTIISLIGEPPEICDLQFDNATMTANYSQMGLDNNGGYSTLASEFNIGCADKNLLNHANGAFMLGNFVNTPLSTYLADRYGRRLTFLIPLWLSILLCVACSFAPNFTLFLVFRFLSGTCGAAVAVVGFVLTVESVAGSFRSIQALINSLVWVTGIFAVGILHLFIHNWRYLYLCIALPGLFSFLYYWVFPESLHWLIANKKTKEVRRYIVKSSKVNKKTLNLNICQFELNENEVAVVVNGPRLRRSFIDILRKPALVFHMLLNCYIYVVLNFVYWVLTLYSVDMHENKMVGFFLSAAVEVPAGLLAMFLLFLFGRRTVTIISLLGQTISIGLTIFTPQGSTLNLILSLFAKILNTVAWASEPLLLSEMAPTTVRNMCYGLVSTAGEIGSVFAPYLKWIGDENRQKAVITSMSLLAILFSMMSPETNGKPLPQDLDDFDPGPFIHALRKFHGGPSQKSRNRRNLGGEKKLKNGERNCNGGEKWLKEEDNGEAIA